jgi:hypothetical protein
MMRRHTIILALMNLLLIPAVYAHCPLCTAAVGTGVAVTRFYGIDDAIVGVWIGAFIISTALWFSKVLKKRYKIPFQDFLLIILALVFTIVPFYFAGLIGGTDNSIFGTDKLLFGTLAGSLMTYIGIFASNRIKEGRRILFPYQTITLILLLLLLTSFVFWFVVG